ncbi:hypothetical protein BV898_00154 [Hypsibius exemplaris]|uniref:Uncharacterized protein n=1 Tax=Hypsibius exemplaris TaxID=2072580 RepID=A0A1W0XEX5_HYPEX|nr:hypothetical protein BV898_00154 [Hypsibius exemplaris]
MQRIQARLGDGPYETVVDNECNLFLGGLGGTDTAISGGGFFLITKEYLATMTGILFGYTILIYQTRDQKQDMDQLMKSKNFENRFLQLSTRLGITIGSMNKAHGSTKKIWLLACLLIIWHNMCTVTLIILELAYTFAVMDAKKPRRPRQLGYYRLLPPKTGTLRTRGDIRKVRALVHGINECFSLMALISFLWDLMNCMAFIATFLSRLERLKSESVADLQSRENEQAAILTLCMSSTSTLILLFLLSSTCLVWVSGSPSAQSYSDDGAPEPQP